MTELAVDWQRVRAVVFDVDGTLYDQRAMRLRMVRELALRCLARPTVLQEARILRAFRQVRKELAEEEASSIDRIQYDRTADRLGLRSARIETVVQEWILDRPLRHLPACRLAGVRRLFNDLRDGGRRIGVWSDYPVDAKLEALGLAAEATSSPADPQVDRLKPQPAGLERTLEQLAVPPGEALMIGDRDDRDGEAARRLGCPYLLLVSRPSSAVEFANYAVLASSLSQAAEE